jgi:DNA-binding XRE family transcriptional regulator
MQFRSTWPHECIKHSRRQVPIALFCVRNERMTISDRLKQIRSKRFASAAEAARALNINRFTYTQHENGTRAVPRDAAIRYAQFYRVTTDWLLHGRGQPGPGGSVPVVHYVGAGAEMHPFDDHPQGGGLEHVDPPPGVSDCIAARVRGNSMYPMLLDGWLLFYSRDEDGVPDECVGKLCVVCLENGACYVKTLRRGSRKGLFTLESWNAPPMEDARLTWASRVLDIRPS